MRLVVPLLLCCFLPLAIRGDEENQLGVQRDEANDNVELPAYVQADNKAEKADQAMYVKDYEGDKQVVKKENDGSEEELKVECV